MSTLELQQSVLQDVASLLGDNRAMEMLHRFLQELKAEQITTCSPPSPIPGLAYSPQERKQAIEQAEADIAANRIYSIEEAIKYVHNR